MPESRAGEAQPTRGRIIFATVVVIAVALAAWKIIDLRTQPPPPHPIGTTP